MLEIFEIFLMFVCSFGVSKSEDLTVGLTLMKIPMKPNWKASRMRYRSLVLPCVAKRHVWSADHGPTSFWEWTEWTFLLEVWETYCLKFGDAILEFKKL